MTWMRKTRLKANQFPSGLQNDFHVTAALPRDSPKRLAILQQFCNSSAKVYSGESFHAQPARAHGPRRVESDMSQHYHNTHASLFKDAERVRDSTRLARLSSLWHGGRDYDIISGTAVPTEH